MSTRKTPLAELAQPQITPSRHKPSTPHAFSSAFQRTGARLRSSRSIRRNDTNSVNPNSARGILRRLAKITATKTHRRSVTPSDAAGEKENIAPDDEDADEEGLKKQRSHFNIDESIEEEDSELPPAPTPSALIEDTDDEAEQPTITFEHVEGAQFLAGCRSRSSLLPQSDSACLEEQEADEAENEGSTFLTERGRRAISDEPTRMSRYSFGSIRMSEFGSELEIRRESDRREKLAALEADDDYDADALEDYQRPLLGGETENLRYLRQSSPQYSVPASAAGSPELADAPSETFQLALGDEEQDDDALTAHEQGRLGDKLAKADSFLSADGGEDDENQDEGFGVAVPSAVSALPTETDRRQTLLESVAATASTRPRKKLKLNKHGNMVPALPSSLIKKVVHESQEKAGKRKTALGKDHMKALEQATEWFLEQVGEDLAAYSQHGRRKKRVDTDDVLLLMRRQRVLQHAGGLHHLASQWLPRQLRTELDLPDTP